jgi:hypothetical protein
MAAFDFMTVRRAGHLSGSDRAARYPTGKNRREVLAL